MQNLFDSTLALPLKVFEVFILGLISKLLLMKVFLADLPQVLILELLPARYAQPTQIFVRVHHDLYRLIKALHETTLVVLTRGQIIEDFVAEGLSNVSQFGIRDV